MTLEMRRPGGKWEHGFFKSFRAVKKWATTYNHALEERKGEVVVTVASEGEFRFRVKRQKSGGGER